MHNRDNRPGFEPSNYKFRATARGNELLGRPRYFKHKTNLFVFLSMLHQIYINMINRVWDLPYDTAGSSVIPCIEPLCPHVRCEILSRTLQVWV